MPTPLPSRPTTSPRNPALPPSACTIKYDGLSRRIVTELSLTPFSEPTSPPTPLPALYKTTALWDTGAMSSVVTQSTAKALNLIPIGATTVNHAGGSSQSNTYLANFFLPNFVIVPGVLVIECPDNAGAFGAIIGMDIIAQGDFSITNVNGLTWMSFRIPSVQTIDYVVEVNRAKFAGVRRNDPCPCGKQDARGKSIRFKDCHGK